MALEIDQPAPFFKLPFATDSFLSLDDLKGKKAVIYFYPKDNTPGCTTQAQDFQSFLPRFEASNTRVIGVSKDSLSSHKKFSDKYGLTFPLLADPETEMCIAYDVLKEKSMFGKKYMGIVRSTFLIDADGLLKAQWLKVKVPNHVEEVLKEAEQLP